MVSHRTWTVVSWAEKPLFVWPIHPPKPLPYADFSLFIQQHLTSTAHQNCRRVLPEIMLQGDLQHHSAKPLNKLQGYSVYKGLEMWFVSPSKDQIHKSKRVKEQLNTVFICSNISMPGLITTCSSKLMQLHFLGQSAHQLVFIFKDFFLVKVKHVVWKYKKPSNLCVNWMICSSEVGQNIVNERL